MRFSLNRLTAQRVLVVTIIIAIAIRIVMAFALGDEVTPISGAWDQESYDMLAQRVAEGKGLTFPVQWYPFTPPDQPTAHWSYLYTSYLAGIYAVFGHHPLVARLIQSIISGLTVWLTYRIGRRLFGEWVGLTASMLTSVYAYFIFFNAALMTQTFYIISVLAAIDLTLGLIEKPALRGWVMLGITIGIGALVRQTLLLFAPLMFVSIAWANRRRLRWSGMLVSIALIALCVLPWTIYNYFTFHDFLLLNSNSGFWFYSSNHPNQGTNFDPTYVAPIPEEFHGLSEPAEDRALTLAAIGFISADPQRFLLLSLNRAKDLFWLFPSEQSSLESNLGRVLSFTVYFPFMLYGLYLSRRQWRACVPLYLYVAFEVILCLVSWSAPRYRLPSDAVMMAFASLAVVDLATRLGVMAYLERWVTPREGIS